MTRWLPAIAVGLISTYPFGYLLAWITLGDQPTRLMQACYVVAAGGWLLLLRSLYDAETSQKRPLSLRNLLLIGLLFRAVLLPAPVSDDVYRYVWEGRVRLAGYNPYLLAPDAEVLRSLRDDHWPLVNHPEHAAIYPPTIQLVFTTIAAISPNLMTVKLVMVAADLGAVVLLAGWLRRRGMPEGWAGIYALCPLTLAAFAREAHLDAFVVLGIATWLVADEQARRRGSYALIALAGAGLGLAVGAKWVPLLLLPWWVTDLNRRASGRIRGPASAAVGTLLVAAMVLLPAIAYKDAGLAIVGPLRHFADAFHTLDLAQSILRQAVDPAVAGALASAAIVLIALAVAGFRLSAARAMLWILGGAILLLPTVHPWYLTWLLPALCARRACPWIVAVVTVVFAWEADRVRETVGEWDMPTWVAAAVFVPVYVAVLASGLAGLWARRGRSARGTV